MKVKFAETIVREVELTKDESSKVITYMNLTGKTKEEAVYDLYILGVLELYNIDKVVDVYDWHINIRHY